MDSISEKVPDHDFEGPEPQNPSKNSKMFDGWLKILFPLLYECVELGYSTYEWTGGIESSATTSAVGSDHRGYKERRSAARR